MNSTTLDRRTFLRGGTLLLAGSLLDSARCAALLAGQEAERPKLRVGLVTDLHYADKAPAGSRHYRETLGKLEDAGRQFTDDRVDLVVELGDFIDAADSVALEKTWLARIQKSFAALPGKHHYVLGNHCVDTLTKEEFLGGVERERSYHSFDAGGMHFVVLDACFRSDGTPYGRKNFNWTDPNIPPAELEWLAADLRGTDLKTLVFVHQRLDVGSPYGIKNAAAVRAVLEKSGQVAAVFQGHSHKNDYRQIEGIHYTTLVAMVEGSGQDNNGFSTLHVWDDGTLRLNGFKKQEGYRWKGDDA